MIDMTGHCAVRADHGGCDGVLRYGYTGWHWYCACHCHPAPQETPRNRRAVETWQAARAHNQQLQETV